MNSHYNVCFWQLESENRKKWLAIVTGVISKIVTQSIYGVYILTSEQLRF